MDSLSMISFPAIVLTSLAMELRLPASVSPVQVTYRPPSAVPNEAQESSADTARQRFAPPPPAPVAQLTMEA